MRNVKIIKYFLFWDFSHLKTLCFVDFNTEPAWHAELRDQPPLKLDKCAGWNYRWPGQFSVGHPHLVRLRLHFSENYQHSVVEEVGEMRFLHGCGFNWHNNICRTNHFSNYGRWQTGSPIWPVDHLKIKLIIIPSEFVNPLPDINSASYYHYNSRG